MMVEGKTRRRGDQREVPATCRSTTPTGSGTADFSISRHNLREHTLPSMPVLMSLTTTRVRLEKSAGQIRAARRVRSNLAALLSIASYLAFYSDNRAALSLGLFDMP